ncbi:hypothetical protein BDR05DRAFT_868670, partial [Suillus weaverae]
IYLSPTPHIPYHTSILMGEAWVYELTSGHPNRICHNLGVSLDAFESLHWILKQNSISQSHNGISIEEQLDIFLY